MSEDSSEENPRNHCSCATVHMTPDGLNAVEETVGPHQPL